jgi:HEAT repeat protein
MEIRILIETLTSGSLSEKRLAIEELIDSPELSIEHIEVLVSLLEDKDEPVRDVAAMCLKILPDEFKADAAEMIVRYISSSDLDVRNLSGDVLQNLGSYSCEALSKEVNSSDFDVRKFAIDILALIGDGSVEDVVAGRIDDSDANVRLSVVECLGNLKSEGFVGQLIELFPRDEQMQLVIIDALGKIGTGAAEDFLVEIIKTSDDEFISLTAIEALSECAKSANVYYFLAELLKTYDSMMQLYILKAMSAIAFRLDNSIVYPGYLRPIAYQALEEQDEDIVIAGLMVLGEKFSPEDIGRLCTLVQKEKDEINTWILYLLGSKLDLFFLGPFMDYLFERSEARTLLHFSALLNQVASNINQKHFETIRDLIIKKAQKYLPEIVEVLKEEFLI